MRQEQPLIGHNSGVPRIGGEPKGESLVEGLPKVGVFSKFYDTKSQVTANVGEVSLPLLPRLQAWPYFTIPQGQRGDLFRAVPNWGSFPNGSSNILSTSSAVFPRYSKRIPLIDRKVQQWERDMLNL